MSTLSDVLAATRKVLLITEDMKRLTDSTEALAAQVEDHEHRLICLETIVKMTPRRSHRTLPGK